METPARLHFGVLNPTGKSARRFGGVGLGVRGVGFKVEMERNERLMIDGPSEQREKAREIVQNLSKIYNFPKEVKIEISEIIPSHVGLGSTTQLTLALGSGITTLFGIKASALDIARETGRGKRSGIGSYIFDKGGIVVEGGGLEEEFPPLIFRSDFPEKWRFVVAIPDVERGPEEKGEGEFFKDLERREDIAKENCYVLVLKLLPALKRKDAVEFGEALTEIDKKAGEAFSPTQGGMFKDNLVSRTRDRILEEGAYGAGQSSWGPSVYGMVESHAQANELKEDMEEFFRKQDFSGDVFIAKPFNRGAKISVED